MNLDRGQAAECVDDFLVGEVLGSRDWMLHGERELTTGGNPRPPPMTIYLEWIVKAWDSIPKEAISKSFNTCGVTNAVDGSEDNEIHCFKPDGPVPTGRDLLKQARAEKKIIELIEEIGLSENENNNVYDSEVFVDG